MPTTSPTRAELRAQPWLAAVIVGVPLTLFMAVSAASVAGIAGLIALPLLTVVGVAFWERARRRVAAVADADGIHLTDLLGEVITVPWGDVDHVTVEVPKRTSPLGTVRIQPRSEDQEVVFSTFRFAGGREHVEHQADAFRSIVAAHATDQQRES